MPTADRADEQRAASPQLPELSQAQQQKRDAFEDYRRDREKVERRSVVRGLILIAMLVLVGSILRAGLDRVFVHGWWRP